MHDFIHQLIQRYAVEKHGELFWTTVLEKADLPVKAHYSKFAAFDDKLTVKLLEAIATLSGTSVYELWEHVGHLMVEKSLQEGWEELLRAQGSNLQDFINNLDSLHYYLDGRFCNFKNRNSSFGCEPNIDGSLTLFYRTKRSGIYPMVKGAVQQVANQIFNLDVSVTMVGRTQKLVHICNQDRVEENVTFRITVEKLHKNISSKQVDNFLGTSGKLIPLQMRGSKLQVKIFDFGRVFPYHVVFDQAGCILQIGCRLRELMTPKFHENQSILNDFFEILWPDISLDFASILSCLNGTFILKTKNGSFEEHVLKLKGEMVPLQSRKHIIFLASPYISCMDELLNSNMRLADFEIHDNTRDVILMNTQLRNEVEMNAQHEAVLKEITQLEERVEAQKNKNLELLGEILTPVLAQKINDGQQIVPAFCRDSTVLFADVPGFGPHMFPFTPAKITVQLLDELLLRFDRLAGIYQVCKVQAISDSYLLASNVPEPQEKHTEIMCFIALGMLWETKTVMEPATEFKVRIGIAHGPVVGGILASQKAKYRVLGQAVGEAKNMAFTGNTGRIHCTKTVVKKASSGRFMFQPRVGKMDTFWLTASNKRSLWEIIDRPRDPAVHSIGGYKELHTHFSGIEMPIKKKTVSSAMCCVQ